MFFPGWQVKPHVWHGKPLYSDLKISVEVHPEGWAFQSIECPSYPFFRMALGTPKIHGASMGLPPMVIPRHPAHQHEVFWNIFGCSFQETDWMYMKFL